ncbi:hypothetical protein CASFOL_035722 [Castilleja foliolosa]|uniref:Pentatricopeptide repeat-containing protein n=1 Tax=Castilleja foliolosa TaxID=1961234 RepID=A0ABD3BTN5_9LAMI
MESLSSCQLSPKPQPETPSPLFHPFHPLKPIFPGSTDTNVSFQLKASPSPIFPLAPPKHKPQKFHEKNMFPDSIPIHKKNPHAIYRDIQRFARQNNLDKALAILDYLDHRGVPTNVTTLSSLISACTRLKSIKIAKQVHAHVRINNLTGNEFLQTKLVHMYASCGSLDDAKRVFETMSVTSVYPWNALLRGNVVLGGRNHREVLGSFLEMRASGVDLNVYTFSSLIKSLAGNRAFRQGLKTHGLLIKNGLFTSYIVRTSLIDMYFKCGKVMLACRVFDEIEEKDVVVWGAMIAGFAHNRLQREALEYARWMVNEGVEVNSIILTSVLSVIGEVNARRIGQEVHAYVIKTKGYVNETFIQSGLVDMYCKCGDMVSGRKVFYGSVKRTLVSWTALLSGYVANGRLEQALRSIIWMQQEGFKPDVVTISTVLPVCGKLKALRNGKEIHAYAIKNGILPGVSVTTSLMMMYSKCSILDYSVKLFDKMERKNVIAWTAMIQCYMEIKCLDEAIRVFRLMQFSEHRPDSVTIARMLNVCGELKVKKLGKEIHGQTLRRDLDSVPFVSAEIVKMYGSWGESDVAKLAFDAISVKGSMTWTAVLEAYRCNSRYEEAICLFKKMILDGFCPNQFTFKVVLEVCREGGFADDALSFFTLMTKKYKIRASEEHYSRIIDLLARFGRTEEAEKFIRLRSSLAN